MNFRRIKFVVLACALVAFSLGCDVDFNGINVLLVNSGNDDVVISGTWLRGSGLKDQQVSLIDNALNANNDRLNIVAMHHPISSLHYNQNNFKNVLTDGDVYLLLAGHTHDDEMKLITSNLLQAIAPAVQNGNGYRIIDISMNDTIVVNDADPSTSNTCSVLKDDGKGWKVGVTAPAVNNGIRIVHMTDVHVGKGTGFEGYGYPDPEMLERFENKLMEISLLNPMPDMLIITGDLIHWARPELYQQFAEAINTKLDPNITVSIINGNHDFRDVDDSTYQLILNQIVGAGALSGIDSDGIWIYHTYIDPINNANAEITSANGTPISIKTIDMQ